MNNFLKTIAITIVTLFQATAIAQTVTVSTFAGSGRDIDGTGSAVRFDSPNGVAIDLSGNVYVADANSHKIRKITAAGVVTTFAGTGMNNSTDGIGTAASFSSPAGLAVDASGNVFVAEYGSNKIRKITPAGIVSTVAGSGANASADGIG
jgi:serine/threonine protein kinase, bacterial